MNPHLLIGRGVVRVISSNGLEGSQFNPPREQVRFRSTDESTSIRCTHSNPAETEIEQHRSRKPQVVPGAAVVASPGCGIPLPPRIAGTCQHEGAHVWSQFQQPFVSGARVLHPIYIVKFKVVRRTFLKARLVATVLHRVGHCLVGTVEDGRLIHVVPESGDSHVYKWRIERSPPRSGSLAREVWKYGSTRPYL